jgi:type III pantothenate kinase
MTPTVVVDIGNTRLKFAPTNCNDELEEDRIARLPPDPAAWDEQLREWGIIRVAEWQVASVHPARLADLRAWVRARGEQLFVVDHFSQLPLTLNVEFPERVGLDRLLNALAAKDELPKGTPAVVVDVGTAVTIDWLDEAHVFQGGAILPGPRLMFDSLHRHTAALPLIEEHGVPSVDAPGKHTAHAIELGVRAAQVGAVEFLAREYARTAAVPPWLFLTGGAVGAMADYKFPGVARQLVEPLLTLFGIRTARPPEGYS